MTATDILPDIHGQHEKLRAALAGLGWRRSPAGWIHPEPDRSLLFLGDFIDRGPENAAVLRIVRSLIDAGKARAVMGNHELNAILFHRRHPDSGAPLRPHTDQNLRQHAAFLAEFPLGAPHTREAIGWMQSLPLILETPEFRAVHACWRPASIARLRELTDDGRLSDAQVIRAADRSDPLYALTEEIAKGPEHLLPDGTSFTDKDGTERHEIRVQWWRPKARNWREVALSVPDPAALPDTPLPPALRETGYDAGERPVFFGHYWLSGRPVLQGPNVLCLDYSAGKAGPLVSYEWRAGDRGLSLDRLRAHGA